MARILFLTHRLPYPPNKGDKVRSYHLLKHLSSRHEVHLGTFVDDPLDEAYLPEVRAMCAGVYASRLTPRTARLASLMGLVRGEPLTLAYYHDRAMHAWTIDAARRVKFDAVLVFSSSMAQYATTLGLRMLVDFVDLDSAKWTQYATEHAWPLSWLYQREGRKLLEYERSVARKARACFFVTDKEVALFESLAPDCIGLARAVGNGVDAQFFAPDPMHVTPFERDEVPVVFTGAMDYWPNVDAVKWFATEMLPSLHRRWPRLRFHVVGRSPLSVVQALASRTVNVTGSVLDVRPYLQHAAVVVAPMRLARGVQNKVLEAMAMARPVVAASACVEAIDAVVGRHLIAATCADDYVVAVQSLLEEPERARAVGRAARERVISAYGWDARLRALDSQLEGALAC